MSFAIRSTMTDATPDRGASYPPGGWGGNGSGLTLPNLDSPYRMEEG